MIVVCDTDFLSSLLKINRLEMVKDLFKEEILYIPAAVLSEIAKTDLITDLLNKDWIKVRKAKEEDLKNMGRDKEFASLYLYIMFSHNEFRYKNKRIPLEGREGGPSARRRRRRYGHLKTKKMSGKEVSATHLIEVIESAKKWLLVSGIQNVSQDHNTISGSFNSWYDTENKNYGFLYPEITGYAITTFLYLNHLEGGNISLVRRAELAAEWIINQAIHERGGVDARYYYDPVTNSIHGNGMIYTFDNGIVLCGITNLYKQIKRQEYFKAIEKIRIILDNMQKPDRSFYAIYDSKTGELVDSPEKWSTQSGSYHAKLAIGFLNLYSITEDVVYKNIAQKICENTLKNQQKDGRFVTYKRENNTHMHPYCYSAEGFLFAGLHLNENKFIKSATNATKWLLDNQLDNGGIPCLYISDEFIPYERSDVLAQTLRLAVILSSIHVLGDEYESNIIKLMNRLCDFQCKNNEIT